VGAAQSGGRVSNPPAAENGDRIGSPCSAPFEPNVLRASFAPGCTVGQRCNRRLTACGAWRAGGRTRNRTVFAGGDGSEIDLGLNRDALGVDRAQVRVLQKGTRHIRPFGALVIGDQKFKAKQPLPYLKQRHEVRLRRLLQCQEGRGLETQIVLEVLRKLYQNTSRMKL
jgi:hypothetical protein